MDRSSEHKRLPSRELHAYASSMSTDLGGLLTAVQQDLGDSANWQCPVEFHDSLALCALNSAYSLRATSASVKKVISLYRESRATADTDSGPDLLQFMQEAGGPEDFARDVLQNLSKLPGTSRLRTVGIHEALTNRLFVIQRGLVRLA
ncbi:hypothetical protein EFN79_06000 [Propionibacterium freudenreichii]|nr:hypothetical protein [Propionibacterium freudenreichii]MCT2987708.1 hypothetical protein [Propionibacterium freudenreichii]